MEDKTIVDDKTVLDDRTVAAPSDIEAVETKTARASAKTPVKSGSKTPAKSTVAKTPAAKTTTARTSGTRSGRSSDYQKGDIVGKYKIIEKIAEGGMGAVFKAVHPSLKSIVIIKKLTLKGGNATVRDRFRQEAKILQGLTSENVVKVFDHFTEGRTDFIVMEYVDGMSLDKLIKKQVAVPPQMALLIFRDACYGLRNAHKKGIVHRDIKPGNILISRKGEIKLADFGIASLDKEEEKIRSQGMEKAGDIKDLSAVDTKVGSSMGTPAYMSPEQMEDSSSVDQRADIYSMGVMLYEMVTGCKPYSEDIDANAMNKIKRGKYIPPEKLVPGLPRIISRLIKKMMKVKPSSRYQSLDPVIEKINRYLKQYDNHAIRVAMVQSMLSKNSYNMPVFKRKKNPERIVLLSLVGALAFAGLIYYSWNAGFFHYTILRRMYTPVNVTLELPSTASADADLPARIFFFEDDNDTLPEVKNSRRIFAVSKKWLKEQAKKGEDSKPEATVTYEIKTVFLKPGVYRIKIAEGPYVWWSSLNVTHEKMKVNLDYLKDAKRNLKIKAVAQDAATGEDITSSTKFFILTSKGWEDMYTVLSRVKTLPTGTVYKIIARKEGYVDEFFSLRIDWYQDELYINCSLKKK